MSQTILLILLPSFFPSLSYTPFSFPSPFLCYTARQIRILPLVSLSANTESIRRCHAIVQVVLLLNTFPCDSPVVSKSHSLPCFTLFVLLIFYPPNHLSSSYCVVPYENQIQQKFAQISLISDIYIFRRKLNNDKCILSPLLMLYLKEILYQVLDRNNVYDRVILLLDDCELDNLPDMVIQ